MKARVKATGEMVEVSPYWTEIHTTNGGCYEMTEVELIPDPDYWERLKHQYAGMAMQGILSNNVIMNNIRETKEETMIKIVTNFATNYAHALVEKLKELEEKK